MSFMTALLACIAMIGATSGVASAQTWSADNGDGTFSNPPHRYLRVDPVSAALAADGPGPVPDGKDGARLTWIAVP